MSWVERGTLIISEVVCVLLVGAVGIVLIWEVLSDGQALIRLRLLPSLLSCLHLTIGVSILELVLILAMKHLREVHLGEPLNFEMVFDGMFVCVRTVCAYLSLCVSFSVLCALCM